MTTPTLEQLKLKYQSVLNLMNNLGVQLKNVHLQENKLVIRGEAKTKSDSFKVWDQIKLVNRHFSQDLIAEITFLKDDLGGQETPPHALRVHVVVPGDTLSKIAKTYYGDASLYKRIYEANKDKLKDPDTIVPGQVLVIPE